MKSICHLIGLILLAIGAWQVVQVAERIVAKFPTVLP